MGGQAKITPAIRYSIEHVALHLLRDGEKVTAKNRLVKLERSRSNALLLRQMFAASDLYEAVIELLATHPAAYRDAGPIENRTDNAVKVARAALAKARGES